MIIKVAAAGTAIFFRLLFFSYLACFEKFTRTGILLYDQVYPKSPDLVREKREPE
jgi:hypothetical protein